MSILDDLATLPVTAEFEVATNSDDYQDPTPPAPVKEGKYRLKVTEFDLDRKQDGTVNLTDGEWPVVILKRIEVVEPADRAGRTITFQRVYSKEFPRNGGVKVSGLSDLVRAYDQTAGAKNAREAIELLHKFVAEGATFRGKVIWSAYDKDHAEQKYAEVGGKSVATKEQHKAIRKEATLKGMTKFPKQADGSYSPVAVGKSGATLEARAELDRVYPSGDETVTFD